MNLQELYQEVILDHNRNPRNCFTMDSPTASAEGYNPLCGDKLSLYLEIDGDTVIAASFVGSGCAISTASASLMTDSIKGKSLAELNTLFDGFIESVTKEGEVRADLGKLAVLAGVKTYPSRVKCATLAWHTLQAALKNDKQPATTE